MLQFIYQYTGMYVFVTNFYTDINNLDRSHNDDTICNKKPKAIQYWGNWSLYGAMRLQFQLDLKKKNHLTVRKSF